MKKFHPAFTLAEVLVVLIIIGIIAAITIPGLVQNTQEAQFKTAFKKIYADIDQAYIKMALDHNNSLKNLCPDYYLSCYSTIENILADYLSHVKACNIVNTIGNCWHAADGSAKYLNGNKITYWDSDRTGLILSNGALVNVTPHFTGCTKNSIYVDNCAWIMVDVNGFKGPNTWGKDMYGMHVTANGLKPWGIDGDAFDYSPCSTSGSGQSCAIEILKK